LRDSAAFLVPRHCGSIRSDVAAFAVALTKCGIMLEMKNSR